MNEATQHPFVRKIAAFIAQEALFPPKSPILAACSGGMDSVCLVHVLHLLEYKVGIAHCNFSLRGRESDADADFVREMADGMALPFFFATFDTEKEAAGTGRSIQETARSLRYDWLENTRKSAGYHFAATGHQMNDQAETVVFNMVRQSGLAGLHGILPRRDQIVRPLLCVTRNEIADYIRENGLSFREDASNTSLKYTRNVIRQKLLPEMEVINPQVVPAIEGLARKVREAEVLASERIAQFRRRLLKPVAGGHELSYKLLLRHPAGRTILYSLLREFDFTEDRAAEIYDGFTGQAGGEYLSSTHRIIRDRSALYICPLVSDHEAIRRYDTIPDQILFNGFKIQVRTGPVEKATLRKSEAYACFDLDTIELPLTIRHWKSGDYFYPLGLAKPRSDKPGKKKLSKYFKDEKMKASEKAQIPVLFAGDRLIWLVGHRMDDRHKVTEKTTRVLKMKVLKSPL